MKKQLRRVSLILVAMPLLCGCPDDVGQSLAGPAGINLAAPTNLSGVSLAGETQILITWIDNATGETGYRVDINDAPFITPTILAYRVLPADSTSFTWNTFPGTTLYFRVLAVTESLQSDPSNVISVSTSNVHPAPTGLAAAAVSSSGIGLAWFDTLGETGYSVERSVDGGFTWSTRTTLFADSTRYNDGGLLADTEYCYRVIALYADGNSLPSIPACAITQTAAMTILTVASAGDVGRHASLDGIGTTEYISHYDATNRGCLLTSGPFSPPSPPYTTTPVDSGPSLTETVGSDGTSLGVDGLGFVHIAAHDATNGDLRYITNSPSSSFVVTSIDTAGFVGASPKLRISPSGNSVHIVYVDDLLGADNLKHASLAGPSWTFESILPSPEFLGPFSFAIDSGGNYHLAYVRTPDGVTFELVYGSKISGVSGAIWRFTPVTSANRPSENSIAVDASGVPHIAYYTSSPVRRLMHATNETGPWTTEIVHEEPGGDVGRYNSITIHPTNGRIHVAYYDAVQGDLRYARKDPAAPWFRRLIDTTGDVGTYTSIGVDFSNTVHIAYRDETNGDLRVARGAP